MPPRALPRLLFAEFLGTFMLVFAGCGAVVFNDLAAGPDGGPVTHVGVALTFGLIVLAIVYAIGDISGAHVNPAVTIAFWADWRFPAGRVAPYIAAQCLGAIVAAALLKFFHDQHPTLGATLPNPAFGSAAAMKAAILETILTFWLMFVVLGVSTGSKEKGITAGIAVGATVALEALFAGPVCGASMNPARSLGPALISGHTEDLWVYLLAPTLGALLAVPAYRLARGPEAPPGAPTPP